MSGNVTAVIRLCSPPSIPVQTQQKPAEDGQLIFLAAGDQAVTFYAFMARWGKRGGDGYFICFGFVLKSKCIAFAYISVRPIVHKCVRARLGLQAANTETV